MLADRADRTRGAGRDDVADLRVVRARVERHRNRRRRSADRRNAPDSSPSRRKPDNSTVECLRRSSRRRCTSAIAASCRDKEPKRRSARRRCARLLELNRAGVARTVQVVVGETERSVQALSGQSARVTESDRSLAVRCSVTCQTSVTSCGFLGSGPGLTSGSTFEK